MDTEAMPNCIIIANHPKKYNGSKNLQKNILLKQCTKLRIEKVMTTEKKKILERRFQQRPQKTEVERKHGSQ